MIDEDLDAALERLALAQHTSKAALIRLYVRERVQPLPPIEEDPLFQLVGMGDFEPSDIDETVYG